MSDEFIPRLVTKDSSGNLKIVWNDNKECVYNLRKLRFSCQCALCKHEVTGKKLISLENIAADINLIKVEVVGNYALHFNWSDDHSTGIYSYEYLRKLCH